MAVGVLLALTAFVGDPAARAAPAARDATAAATGATTNAPASSSTDLSSTPARGGLQQHAIAHGSLARSSQRATRGSVPRLPNPLAFRSPATPGSGPGIASVYSGPAEATLTTATGGGYVAMSPIVPPPVPATSTLNFPLGDTRGNGFVTPLNGSGDTYVVYIGTTGKTTHLIIDLSGYFE